MGACEPLSTEAPGLARGFPSDGGDDGQHEVDPRTRLVVSSHRRDDPEYDRLVPRRGPLRRARNFRAAHPCDSVSDRKPAESNRDGVRDNGGGPGSNRWKEGPKAQTTGRA